MVHVRRACSWVGISLTRQGRGSPVALGELECKRHPDSVWLQLDSITIGQNSTQDVLSDPRESYSPNFTLPEQAFPVLQSTFETAPDCGETSYTGSGRLEGRRALISGGDCGIRRAVAIAFAREGADASSTTFRKKNLTLRRSSQSSKRPQTLGSSPFQETSATKASVKSSCTSRRNSWAALTSSSTMLAMAEALRIHPNSPPKASRAPLKPTSSCPLPDQSSSAAPPHRLQHSLHLVSDTRQPAVQTG